MERRGAIPKSFCSFVSTLASALTLTLPPSSVLEGTSSVPMEETSVPKNLLEEMETEICRRRYCG